jgi:ABC-type multidrug transport system fused ATPase/permease subunit
VAVVVAGVSAALALTLLLFTLPLVADLLSNRGELTVGPDESAAVSTLRLTPNAADNQAARFENSGLLPIVWRWRHSMIGASLQKAYALCPALRSNQSCFLTLIISVWVLALLAAVTLFWLALAVHKRAVLVAGALRKQIHAQTHQLGPGDLFVGQKLTAAELLTHSTETVHSALCAWWWLLPHATCFAVLALGVALSVSFWLALTTILSAAVCWRLLVHLRQRARQRMVQSAASGQVCLARLLDQLQHNRLLGKLSIQSGANADAFDNHLRRYDSALIDEQASSAIVGPLFLLIASLGLGLVLLLAGFNVLQNPPRLNLAEAVLLCAALMATVYPLICFERVQERLPDAEQAAADIFTYLDREPRVGQLPDAAPLEHLSRQILFEHVTLADMTGRPLLDDVTFAMPAGQPVVLYATDEATSLAIAGLLARFCDPAAGQVLFDGRDVRRATLPSVRRQVALVLPDHLLIDGTVAENIVGDDNHFTSDEIISAAKQVHAYEFIQSLPEGLETMLGADGISLSVGQAIRLGLTRVGLQRPSVLLIAEPREDLDQVAAERIADALDQISRDSTIVILARRLAVLRSARRILLFHEGRLLADGTHQELLQRDELYRHLNYVRFNEFRDKVK